MERMSQQSSASHPATSASDAPAAPVQEARLRPIIALEVDPTAPRDPPLLAACYRAFEFTLALTALVMTLPIMLIEEAVIRLDTPGPVLFFHTRAGRSKIMRGSELVGRTDIAPVSGSFDPDKLYHVPTTFRLLNFGTMKVIGKDGFREL